MCILITTELLYHYIPILWYFSLDDLQGVFLAGFFVCFKTVFFYNPFMFSPWLLDCPKGWFKLCPEVTSKKLVAGGIHFVICFHKITVWFVPASHCIVNEEWTVDREFHLFQKKRTKALYFLVIGNYAKKWPVFSRKSFHVFNTVPWFRKISSSTANSKMRYPRRKKGGGGEIYYIDPYWN